jgi:DNA topoisomerase-3
MRLFIAEKPSLARAIAEALPGPHVRAKTHIACGGGDVVAWCAGHILETAAPEAYGAQYKEWRLGDLPITPGAWKLEVTAPELLAAIKKLLSSADQVVHAGDPDREGQLLVDEVLAFLGYKGSVDRLLVRDLRPEAVRRQLAALEPNAKYRPLGQSALARQRADWLYGINMTRLYTLLGRAAGYGGVLSVGRVQTPLLGFVVARDRAIAQFKPRAYYVVSATLRTERGQTFRAFWDPCLDGSSGVEEHFDSEKRLLKREVADAVRARAQGQLGAVTARTQERKSELPPLPYSLADLQMDAGRKLGLSAQAVLDACQSLYETHRLTTYPRSDCPHLPEGHHGQATEVLQAIRSRLPAFALGVASADVALRSKAWNDKKVTAHHAIIPTPNVGSSASQLPGRERAIYELICRRYLAQFYPAHQYLQTRVELDVGGEHFVASGRQSLLSGWKVLGTDDMEKVAADSRDDVAHENESDSAAPLPRLEQGDRVTAVDVPIAEKQTRPPKPFTDASLMAAMCAVSKFVTSPNIKKILSETDGIGTPATRAAIIETLFARGYVERSKTTIVSTPTGRALIETLPDVATTPDMTALWELGMRAITEGQQSLPAFLGRVSAQLEELVRQGKAVGRIAVPEAARLPKPAAAAQRGVRAAGLSASRAEKQRAKPESRSKRTRGRHASD